MNTSAVKSKLEEYLDFDEIFGLVRGFETGTLPRAQWTHRAHLTVACWYLVCHAEPDATLRIREGIKKYNSSQGIVTTKERGYHETMTLFWAKMVRGYLAKTTLERPLAHIVNDLVVHYSDKNLPFEYYSRDRLMSDEARMNWMEPDLKLLA
ncbi:MAG: hypothetical protein M3X11_09800 [Acidobacteriota bacterium]|nr:hypothetical protein [Acidobacteriota bacterium]